MITLTAAEQTALASRSARVGVQLRWTYNPTDQVGSGDYTIANISGYDHSGVYRQDYNRLEELTFEQRLPYLGEGLYFPTLHASMDMSRGNLHWYDYTTGAPAVPLANNPMVGGWLRLYAEIGISDSSTSLVEIMRRRVDEVRPAGIPPRLEIVGASGCRCIMDRVLDATLTLTRTSGYNNPAHIVNEVLQTAAFIGVAHLDSGSINAAVTALGDSCIRTNFRALPESEWRVADIITQAAWHGYGSLYIDTSDNVHWYDWSSTYGGTPDATWTAADIIAGTAALVPRYDRVRTATHFYGNNTYLNTTYSATVFHGNETWFERKVQNWRLDFYDITTAGGLASMTTILAGLGKAFNPLRADSCPRVPTQFRCSVPFSVGLPMQIGDFIKIVYPPLGLTYSVFRVEEIRFKASTLSYDFVLQDRYEV